MKMYQPNDETYRLSDEEWDAIPADQRLKLILNGEMAEDPPEDFTGEDPRQTPPYSGMQVDPLSLPTHLQRVLAQANPALAGSPWSHEWQASNPNCPRHFRAGDDGGLTIGEVDDFCNAAAKWFNLPPELEIVITWSPNHGFEIQVV